MSREIKFRVWDKKCEWFASSTTLDYAILVRGGVGTIDFSHGSGYNFGESFNYDLQQYTGLKDKNDKEIYEGDIVKVNKNHEAWLVGQCLENPLPEYDRGEIRMSHGCWKICQKRMGAAELYDYSCCEEHPCALEVIGNIFENPELPAPE